MQTLPSYSTFGSSSGRGHLIRSSGVVDHATRHGGAVGRRRADVRCASAQQQQQHGDPAPGLRLFLDTADVSLWRRYAPTGALWGVTTNPAILQKDGVPCTYESAAALASAASELRLRELQLQAWGGSADALLESALRLLEIGRERMGAGAIATVKLPCTAEGLGAAAALRRLDPSASVTVTGVYAAHQALLARAVGADYVAPYLGRMADASSPEAAFEQVATMQAAMRVASEAGGGGGGTRASAAAPTRVLVASIRGAGVMAALAARGCDTFTFAPAVMEEMLSVPATLKAVADFEAAAAANQLVTTTTSV